jgi:hypothetical protein
MAGTSMKEVAPIDSVRLVMREGKYASIRESPFRDISRFCAFRRTLSQLSQG